jgi:uncharacterized membrane protein YfcA
VSFETLILISVAFGLGGVLKGATGVGAPFLAIPIMAILVDVPFAVAVFLVSNIVANAGQIWRFRAENENPKFAYGFAITGMIGAGFGTFALAAFSSSVLTTIVALVVLFYVGFRLLNPGWSLSLDAAMRAVRPLGGLGGFFQGAIGLSGPIAISFVSAVGFPRPQFIFTMSLYFFAMTLVQLPVQVGLGIMTWERAGYGALALAPLLLGMTLGEVIGKRFSKAVFDRVIFGVLTLLALRLLAENFL